MMDWSEFLAGPRDGIKKALNDNHKKTFGEAEVGRVDFGELTYPTVHIIPQSKTYMGDGVFEFRIQVNYYFERRQRDTDEFDDFEEKMGDSVQDILDELAKTDYDIGEYKPNDFRYFGGGLGNKMIEMIEVEFLITKQVDWGQI